jgi:6-phosphogluconate dehydrogenase
MNRDETVKYMAKILCPKGTANCEKCSKNYKCNVNFSQLSQLFDGGCRIIGDDEIVLKKDEYAELCMAEYESIDEAIEYEKQLINLKKDNQEMLRDFAKIVISAIWEEKKNEKIKIKDVHDTIRDILRMNFGIELEEDE